MFYKDERLALFIDGMSLFTTAKTLGMDIDYKLLRDEFARRGKLISCLYYTAIIDSEKVNPLRPLVDWLSYNGYRTVTKFVKEHVDNSGNIRFKNNMDVDLTVDALELSDKMDHAVIFSGDGSLVPLVESLQRKGVRVSIVSTVVNASPIVADRLRRQADNFIDLDDLRNVVSRAMRHEMA